MIVNCEIIQIDAELTQKYNDGSIHRLQHVWIRPKDNRENTQWTSLLELRDEKIDNFVYAGRKQGDVIPVRFKPAYRRFTRNMMAEDPATGELRETKMEVCTPTVYMDILEGGQNNG